MIDDGYTQRLCFTDSSLEFDYRPLLPRQRQRVLRDMLRYGEPRCWRIAEAVIVDQVVVPGPISMQSEIKSMICDLRLNVFDRWKRIFDLIVTGYSDSEDEIDRKNLQTGIPLLKKYRHLLVADTCSLCKKWLFDPERGEFEVDDMDGARIERFPEAVLACETIEGCPNGTPDRPNSLSPKNRRALVHYQECAAIGRFPDDAIVRRNAAIIKAGFTRKAVGWNNQA